MKPAFWVGPIVLTNFPQFTTPIYSVSPLAVSVNSPTGDPRDRIYRISSFAAFPYLYNTTERSSLASFVARCHLHNHTLR